MDTDRYPPIRVWPALVVLAALAGASAVAAQEAAPAPSISPRSVENALALRHTQRVLIQQSLTASGFDVGPADGIFGARSRRGIRNWQAARGEATTGYLDARAVETLLKGAPAATPIRQEKAAEDVKEILAEALRAVPSIEPGFFRHIAYTAIAEGQAKAGDIEGARGSVREALVILRSDEEMFSQADRIKAIAESQAKAGDIHGALDTARSIDNGFYRASALSAIAEVQANADDRRNAARSIGEALGAIQEIEHASWRAPALSRIAKAQAKTGDTRGAHRSIGEALSIVPQIEYVDVRTDVLGGIAEAQAMAGDTQGAAQSIGEALNTVRKINDPFGRAVVLRYISEAQENTGDIHGAARSIGEALGNARNIKEGSSRDRELERIAEAQTEAGDFHGAIGAARSIEDARTRDNALDDILGAQIKAGDFDGAPTPPRGSKTRSRATGRSLKSPQGWQKRWRRRATSKVPCAPLKASKQSTCATARSAASRKPKRRRATSTERCGPPGASREDWIAPPPSARSPKRCWPRITLTCDRIRMLAHVRTGRDLDHARIAASRAPAGIVPVISLEVVHYSPAPGNSGAPWCPQGIAAQHRRRVAAVDVPAPDSGVKGGRAERVPCDSYRVRRRPCVGRKRKGEVTSRGRSRASSASVRPPSRARTCVRDCLRRPVRGRSRDPACRNPAQLVPRKVPARPNGYPEPTPIRPRFAS